MTSPDTPAVVRSLEVQHAVLTALIKHPSLAAAVPDVLGAVCEALDLEVSALWLVDWTTDALRCAGTWAHDPEAVAPFLADTTRRTFRPGEGLPGAVWERGEPLVLDDVTEAGNFPRRAAAEACHLHGGFAFPAIGAGRVLGVIDGFSRQRGVPDAYMRRAVQSVGREIGLVILREEAERQRAVTEARLRGTLDAALDCVITIDAAGTVIDFNAAAERTFGFSRDAIVGQSMALHIVPPRLREAHHSGIQHYLATGEGPVLHRRIEVPAIRADGAEFPAELAITPVRLADGREIFTAFLRDITERKQAEEDLQAARVAAERSAAAKEQFLATVSHELRTPLNAIVGLAHLLDRTPLDAQQDRSLRGIRFAADALLAVVNDLLDFARMRSGRISYAHEPFPLRPILQGLVDFVADSADARGIFLALHVDPEVPETVVGDPSRLNQVLLNLVSNAIKFTQRGGVTIRVSCATGTDASPTLRFSVADTGIGIADGDHRRIFEAFQQAGSETTRRFGGSGLGLAIVKETVQQQGGTVAVESAVGVGSTFHVTLPFGRPAMEPPAGPVRPDAVSLTGRRVLVVEDNEMNRFVATQILERAGAVVATAADGREGVDRVRAEQFDLVLMDIQMPEMDGYEATWRIRHDLGISAERLPIVALTATALTDEERRAHAAGMTDVILKPFRPELLCQRVASLLTGVDLRGAPAVEGHIDRLSLEEQTLGNGAFARDVIDMYLRMTPDYLQQLDAAVAANDRTAVGALAHRMKSQAGTVGAVGLQRAFEALEREARPDLTGPVPVAEVRAVTQLAREVLEELRVVRAHYAEAGPCDPGP